MTWWRQYGTATMPVRQSDLNSIASQNGCAKRFFFEKSTERAAPARAHWRRVLGVAVHAVIERALLRTWTQLEGLYGPGTGRPPAWVSPALRARTDEVLREELARAADGQPIEWMDEDAEAEIAAGVMMAVGAMRTTVERAARVVACEAPFAAELDGYSLTGTIDLVYEPRDRPGALAIADWKTGERRLAQVVIDHGYQTAIYSYALEHGTLWSGTDRETKVGHAPVSIDIVHLRDFVPYVRGPKKGLLRGPGWMRSRRTPDDVARLQISLRTVVGTVRMGRFLEALGEQCSRCPFRGPCLTDGHQIDRGEARVLESALDGLDLTGVLPDVA